MDAELFAESIEYERLTQSVCQDIVRREGQNIEVLHNQDVVGKSGVAHQVDVLWRFTVAGVTYMFLIECKNYASALTLEKVRNFFAVLHDVGNCSGVMVTRTGRGQKSAALRVLTPILATVSDEAIRRRRRATGLDRCDLAALARELSLLSIRPVSRG